MSITIESLGDHDPVALLAEVLADNDAYWPGRDMRGIHHWVWFHQFGRYGLLAREQNRTIGYLLGAVTTSRLGYVHVIAVRAGHRGAGVGRELWRTFARNAMAAGATELQAITSPVNTGSVAFHTRLGMSAREIADYAGPGQHRVLFRAPVSVLANMTP
jgi:ribosomal protein S18 acetylase RimI-like enzyme